MQSSLYVALSGQLASGETIAELRQCLQCGLRAEQVKFESGSGSTATGGICIDG